MCASGTAPSAAARCESAAVPGAECQTRLNCPLAAPLDAGVGGFAHIALAARRLVIFVGRHRADTSDKFVRRVESVSVSLAQIKAARVLIITEQGAGMTREGVSQKQNPPTAIRHPTLCATPALPAGSAGSQCGAQFGDDGSLFVWGARGVGS